MDGRGTVLVETKSGFRGGRCGPGAGVPALAPVGRLDRLIMLAGWISYLAGPGSVA